MYQIDHTKLSLLKKRLNKKARIIVEPDERSLYQRDLGEIPSWFEKALFNTMPDIVIQPFDTSNVSQILKFANKESIPVIPRGCSSWGFGGAVPVVGPVFRNAAP
ncbi:MAG TPA: FAD-binding oxidoreductase [Actinobacteria bacterium]|nr:FAD-binding oxidoreductase [Actinomycetota bacterium]